MHYLTDPLQFEFMRRALMAIVLTGIASGVLGSYVVLRGLAFIGDALTHAVFPGIVVAVALIQFWLAMPVALYGTLAILLLAYVGRYIPLAVRAANAAMRQIDPSLEESAQILGASWLTTMREVTLPLIRPGLFAGWLLVFVPVIQELSASILLFSSSSIRSEERRVGKEC